MPFSCVQAASAADYPPDVEAALQRAAKKVAGLRLELPVVLLLEMHLPVLGILQTAVVFIEPIASPLFGADRMHTLNLILSDRKNVEELIKRIESYSIAKARGKDELCNNHPEESLPQRL